MTATATPTQPFLATILDQHYADFKAGRPYDDGPRLVYADWLEEQGECARAEFIRVQCELANIEVDVERTRLWTKPRIHARRLKALRAREMELLQQWIIGVDGSNCKRWLGQTFPDWACSALVCRDGYDDAECTNHGYISCEAHNHFWVDFHRGFPARFTLTTRQAWGEACEWCDLIRGARDWIDPQRIESRADCQQCFGSGRVGAILPAILAACPVEEVRVSDRSHWHATRGVAFSCGQTTDQIPDAVYDLGMQETYPTLADAHAALSRAVIRHGLTINRRNDERG